MNMVRPSLQCDQQNALHLRLGNNHGTAAQRDFPATPRQEHLSRKLEVVKNPYVGQLRSCSYVPLLASGVLPDALGDFPDEGDFLPLVFLGEEVALLRRGEAALGAQAELRERHVARGLLDARDDVCWFLEPLRFLEVTRPRTAC